MLLVLFSTDYIILLGDRNVTGITHYYFGIRESSYCSAEQLLWVWLILGICQTQSF